MRLLLTTLLVFAASCSDDEDKLYRVGGVPVTLEEGVGPSKCQMTLASEVFRRDALEHFNVDNDQVVWESIEGIYWGDGEEFYDFDDGLIFVRYTGCTITSRLFEMLTTHYRFVVSAETTLLEGDGEWVDQLSQNNARLCL